MYLIPRQVRYSFTLQNRTNSILKKAQFWTYAPVKRTATQYSKHLEASRVYELIEDEFGNQILHFTFDNLPPYATKIITIKADLLLSNTPLECSAEELHTFLKAERYIESDHNEIIQLARELRASEMAQTTKNIFHWTNEHIEYTGYQQNDLGALYALKNRKGDCTEFMHLFVALCRANSIPARGIGGYICPEDCLLRPAAYHNWAEFYENKTWQIADPQKNLLKENQSHYIAFKVIGKSSQNPGENFHRFRSSGDGLTVKMNK